MQNIHVLSIFFKCGNAMCPFTKRFPYPIIYLSVNRNMTDVTSGTETFPVFSSFRATKSLVFYVVYHIIWYVFLSFFAIITLPSVFLFTAPDCHCGIFPYTMYFCFLLWYPMFSIVIHPSQQVRHFFFLLEFHQNCLIVLQSVQE